MTMTATLTRSIHAHWRVYLAEGVALSLLGLLAVIVSPLAGLVATVFLGWLFLIAGVVGLVASFGSRGAPGLAWAVLSAVVAIAAGVLLLWQPLRGLVTLTFVLTGFFIADGVLTIFLAASHRSELTGRWQWMMVNGAIDLLLAGLIVAGFPGTLVWALGVLVGIDLMFGGASLVAMALAARKTSIA